MDFNSQMWDKWSEGEKEYLDDSVTHEDFVPVARMVNSLSI